MIVYRLKHKPTGLFYKALTGTGGTQTNLSETGDIYHEQKNLFEYSDSLMVAVSGYQAKEYNLTVSDSYKGYHQKYVSTLADDWVEVKYELTEVE